MNPKQDPWFLHAGLIVIIVALTFVLIKVAVIDPTEVIKEAKFYADESHARMDNIRQAQILWQKKYGSYTDNLDSLVNYVKTDPDVQKLLVATDSAAAKNPFKKLITTGTFEPDSIFFSPKTHQRYVLKIDISEKADTIVNARGVVTKIEKKTVKGKRYFVECPDGYGSIGDIDRDALLNTASWE